MKPRALKLASGTWRFLIDSHGTTLWSPSGKKHRINNETITGTRSHHCDYAPGCPGPRAMVTPGNLRAYIEATLEPGPTCE
jgi:hypothetical protein